MRYFRKYRFVWALGLCATLAVAGRAEVPTWFQWLDASSAANGILYRVFVTPTGSVSTRRPPRETAPQLAAASAREPSNAELAALTAREYEAQLDFVNAEARWKLLTNISMDRAGAEIELANYYHRRIQPQLELQALDTAVRRMPAVNDPALPETRQAAWTIRERIQELANSMASAVGVTRYESWITQYPNANSVYARYFEYLLSRGMLTRAGELIPRYQRAFPNDRVFPIRARASVASRRGAPGGAIAVYNAAFDPLWPSELMDEFFNELTESHKLYEYYQKARAARNARPDDLAAAARLFHYHKRQSGANAARRELAEFRVRKEAAKSPWTAAELQTLAQLSDGLNDYDEVVRYSYALYSLPGVDAVSAESALSRIISTLLKAPEQPIRFGKGDLSFYRDVATMDSSPGFLNGITSLIFNSQDTNGQFRSQEARAGPYFHRAKAAELYALFSTRFPRSAERPELASRLLDSYEQYGEDDALIRQGNAFLEEFPTAALRGKVALQIADAHARKNEVQQEIGIYDRLLTGPPRAADYQRILERYISRLVQLNRVSDALALYRREIDRDPNDPALYDQLAGFLERNARASEVEQVYRRAIEQFQDRSWSHKLARFYLRNRRTAEFETLSRQIASTFSGLELEGYVSDVTADASLERRIQLEINLYAHRRFPHDLRFTHNLIALYSSGPTANSSELVGLLNQHWQEDERIRRMYFERLAAGGTLPDLVQSAKNALPSAARGRWSEAEASNPAATRFIAEAETWQSHFETAAPILRAVAEAYPSDDILGGRALDMHRSLAAFDPANTARAASIANRLVLAAPRDPERLVRAGEIYADRGMMGPARAAWNRIPGIDSRKPDGYLEAATVFWDYYQMGGALSWLDRGRIQFKDPTLWAYQRGAILESQNRRAEAVSEYARGAIAGKSGASRSRLIQLARRSDYKNLVELETRRSAETASEDPGALRLRIEILRDQERKADLEAMLNRAISRTSSHEILTYVLNVAVESESARVHERALRRQIQLEPDPKETIRLQLQLVRLFESRNDLAAAQQEIEPIYQANPLIAGVIRATTDYFWRHDKTRAIRVLAAASERAHPGMKKEYLVEAARKATEAGAYAEALQFSDALLGIDPIAGQYIALKADALAAQGNQDQIEQLYAAKLAEIQQSALPAADKIDRVATMRRGLIPVLARQSKFREALDQYIEILNRFPDDENLLTEVGRFASQHGLEGPLVEFYDKTVTTSPRDPRWSIVLARLHTQFENYPAAIEAYVKAVVARPERLDLAIAQGGLEERTYRFTDAIATFNRIYSLSHLDAQWLDRAAVLEMRLGRNADALATLRRAHIEGKPAAAREYGKVAEILEQHGDVEAAVDFIQQQLAQGTHAQHAWVVTYARIMTRARRYADAFETVIETDRPDESSNRDGVRSMAQAVATYFTPEEKEVFAAFITSRKQSAKPEETPNFIVLADIAGLKDLEVSWRLEQAALSARNRALSGFPDVVRVQESRMRFAELGRQAEDLASRLGADDSSTVLRAAIRAYAVIGDSVAQLGVFDRHPGLQFTMPDQFFAALARRRPDQLIGIAAESSQGRPDSAIRSLIAANDASRSLSAIQQRKRDPVWIDTATALTGIYFGLNTPEVQSSFQRALGPMTVGDRLGKPVDRTRQIAGNTWFYYGQRYGEYLQDIGNAPAADEYLVSMLEERPGNPQAYIDLAGYYRDIGNSSRAVTEYRHALELDPKRSDIMSRIAVVLWDAGRRGEALNQWRVALSTFEAGVGKGGSGAASQFEPGAAVFSDIRSRKQTDSLRREMDRALRVASRGLQAYQSLRLLQAVFANSEDPADAQWLVDVAFASPSSPSLELVTRLADQAWLSPAQRERILPAAIGLLAGSSTTAGNRQYFLLRRKYLEFLLDSGEGVKARQLMNTFSAQDERLLRAQPSMEIRLAAMENGLEALMERYRQNPAEAPGIDLLQQAAMELEKKGRHESSQRVLEFMYTRQIEQVNPEASAFLGLAEVRLKRGELESAIQPLRRMNLAYGQPFENLVASAKVLSEGGHPKEAEEFLRRRLEAAPWDDETRLKLATPDDLQRLAASRHVPYDIRAEAARRQAAAPRTGTASAGSRELDLLSNRIVLTPANAEAPYFFAARKLAAEQNRSADTRLQLLLNAVAERPEDRNTRRLVLSAALEAGQDYFAAATYPPDRFDDIPAEARPELAEAHFRLGHFEDAMRLFRLALNTEQDGSRKQTLQDRLTAAQAGATQGQENERRRPSIGENLEQPRPVRRRLQ